MFAYTRTIKDILTLNRKYIIPRFQREFSWEKPEHDMFWDDILSQIYIEQNELKTNDYFIGSIVLVGDDSKDTEFLVVDGQQRLTTITVIFSALTQILKEIDEPLSKSCYSYVEGKDGDYRPFFKLENESPKPFLQRRIQNFDKELDYIPETEEEQKLLLTYDYYIRRLKEENLRFDFKETSKNTKHYSYTDLLKILRDQILSFKTIFITVDNLKEAYTIFETLNAKGKDLETIDLIKNKIFTLLDDDHPTDYAKETWKKIKFTLRQRDESVNLSTFFRHFWISKYSFLTEARIYDSFQKLIPETKKEYKQFLQQLLEAASDYTQIIAPTPTDWKSQEAKPVYNSLVALNLFRVSQHRSFVLVLLKSYKEKLINITDLREALQKIEKFHFCFTAVCSQRASGIEGIYSKASRDLRSKTSRKDAQKSINELILKLTHKLPNNDLFIRKFHELEFTDWLTKNKKLIQYIFTNIEINRQNTSELTASNLSLEHIEPQSNLHPWVWKIGNLLPLASEINSKVGNKDLKTKIPHYRKSAFKITQDFCIKYKNQGSWTDKDAEQRTTELANEAYTIWKL
ncbi:DUF262 domain-containing protein [Pseudoflavitalea sp. G-6-1-2]|uniref:DUF262 domain-containing protein n=1 Tax=Pseudoflavitalea sp. G-6-1-2 TaxID=2728841 RepID=UPI00146F1089|nr:DUF262 domain-containing protein [Pseudoflavitalea sp. G-6-1-2]NML20241.1 DUF262 domain-containing protein [Pseudoflavitalea sp. G-6-1-2]